MPRPFPLKSSSRIRLTLCASLCLGGALAVPAAAQQAPGRQAHSQAAAPLEAALNAYARAARVTLSFDPALVANRQAPALTGTHTVLEGFAALLAGTGLAVEQTGVRHYAVVPAQVNTLAPVTVTGEGAALRDNPPTTVGSKTPLTQRQIAQSVSVITQDRIVQQNLQTLDDAMANTPGVTVERRDNSRSIFHSRGFDITSYQIDGLPTQYDWRMLSSGDLAVYDRVEVLKGPAGLYNGAGGLGGAINLVHKRPEREFAFDGLVSAGSWNNYRSQLDLTGPLNDDGTLRGRLVGVYQDRDFFYDKTNEKHSVLYGVLAYDFTPDTTLTVGASRQERDIHASMWSIPAYMDLDAGGAPRFSLADIKRSTFLGADWNRDRFVSTEAFADIEQRLANGWTAKLAGRYADNRLDREQAYAWGPASHADDMISLLSAKGPTRQSQASYDAYADGPVHLFGRQHHATVGVNFTDARFHNEWNYPTPNWAPRIDITDPRSDFDRLDYAFNNGNDSRTRQWGVYSNLRISLADSLTLVAGGRFSWWDLSSTQRTLSGSKSQDASYNGTFTPNVGLIYDLNNTYSLYASYSEVFAPQNGYSTASGDMLDPLEGKQAEVGIKGEFLNGALNASLAAFQIQDQNRASLAPDSATAYVSTGKTRNRGIELQLSGELRPGWNLYAGYTWLQTRVDQDASYDSNVTAVAPKHLLRIWSDYRLPGAWNRVTVGAGVNVQSGTYVAFPQYGGARLEQGGYATVDMKLGYAFNRNLDAALNITNLFDRKYYQTISSPRSQNIFGEPRAVMLTLRARY
ncbi:TonB-dependent siderophore receptor [Bordetella bronchiseptica GA96-01]|uniref:TonB-dependent siderophore receptor n=1 Tax=Bordetella bronchiseptica TaxID=518 RepID=UPI00045A3EA3|nr:TonB-dependent receptor [Bordetella bronchiseptica]AZW30966.1 TonB-dependent siderophore receptor [Bordetella bronchiseptica]KCV43261.1 TonB-dependent siderophore receptor [Bordetella bronchiseptica 345]KDC40403.1 TonB-dependent siderophore receptor [Bordetella bronchiseptica GA96-01]